MGFCRGGRTVWEYAAHNPNLKAGVAFYGTLVDPPAQSALWPKSPTQLAPEMKAPVLGLYGEADQGISVAQVKAMEAALKAAGKTAEFHIYPGAPHGFHADYRGELPQGSRRGRLEADAGVVQEVQSAELTASSIGLRTIRQKHRAAARAALRPSAGRGCSACGYRRHDRSLAALDGHGIWINSFSRSADSGAGMNFPATASAMIPSIPSMRPVARFSFGMSLRTRRTMPSGSLE